MGYIQRTESKSKKNENENTLKAGCFLCGENMKKYEKEVLQSQLNNEKTVLKKLKQNYQEALDDINSKIDVLLSRDDASLQNVIYQVQYQRSLKKQIEAILETLHSKEFETISEYLTNSYSEGFVGAMYSMHKQGVPLIIPIDQKKVLEAIKHETKLSENLYTSLGHDITDLQKTIASEISRGISSGLGYAEMARNIANQASIPKNRAMTIARTESHRIQCKATLDAQYEAKNKGADVLKQWSGTLDGETREHHRMLDGQIRELEEPFSVGKFKPRFPGDFGDPAEDCNCRCALLQRARWALGKEELNTLKERAEFFGLDKSEEFADFKKKYLQAADRVRVSAQMKKNEEKQAESTIKTLKNEEKSGTIEVHRSVGASAKNYPVKLPDSNQHVKLAEGQKIEGVTFAGEGTEKEIRERYRLESFYKIPASEWKKVGGKGYVIVNGVKRYAELHWYEARGQKVELKVKRYLDEG